MTFHSLTPSHPNVSVDAAPRSSYLQRRLAQAPERELTALRRRRSIAKCLACAAAASAFFGVYALSWMLVLNL